MKKSILFALSIATLIFCSCATVRTSDNKLRENGTEHTQNDMRDTETIQLREGGNMQVNNTNLNISFLKITEDSRCPENVQCVWAGVAVAEIEVMNPFSRPLKFRLATQNLPARGYSKSADYHGYHIELRNIAPAKTVHTDKESSGEKIPYSITLDISKNSAEDTSKGATSR